MRGVSPLPGVDVRRREFDRGWLAIAGALGILLVLSMHAIRAKSFWFDEAVSLTFARMSLAELAGTIGGREANGSVYYLILHGWRLLGDGETWIRFLSVLCVATTIPILYLVGRRHVGAAGSAVGITLFAVSSFTVEYAQEARMYGLAMLSVTAAVLAWSLATETDRKRWWAAYALCATVSLYIHFFCGLVVVGLGLTWLAGLTPRTRRGLVAQAVVVAGALPLGYYLATGDVGQISWIKPFRQAGVSAVLGRFGGGSVALTWLLFAGVAAAIPTRDRARIRRIAPLVAWCLTPIVLGLVISIWKSLLEPRYFIVALPALMLLAGAGFVRIGGWLGGRRARLPVAGAIVVLAIVLGVGPLQRMYGGDRGDWRGAAGWVAQAAEPGDRILYAPDKARYPLGIYLERSTVRPSVEATSADLRAARGRTWLVLYGLQGTEYGSLFEQLPGYRVIASKLFRGNIRIQLVDRP